MNVTQLTNLAYDAWVGKPKKLRSPQWGTVRAEHLKLHPKCECCGATKKVEVHHVKGFHDHPELELEPSNLMSLCDGPNACHRTWGHMYSWQTINPTVRDDVAAWVEHVKNVKEAPNDGV